MMHHLAPAGCAGPSGQRNPAHGATRRGGTPWQTDGVRNPAAVVAAIVAAVLAAACSATPAGDASGRSSSAARPPASAAATASATAPAGAGTPPTARGLTATVVQYTRDRPARVVQVKVTNTADAAVDVTIDAPRLLGFDAAQPPEQTSHLEPGRRVDFPVALGPPACDRPGDGASHVVVRVASAGDPPAQRALPIDDEDGLLPRVHAFDCAVEGVEQSVEVTVDDGWRRVGSGADAAVAGRATMALRPGADLRTARLADLDAGLLLGVRSGAPESPDDDTYVIDADRPVLEWDLELVGARCDEHALAESRRLMALTFWISVDGAEPVPLRRSPDVAGYEAMVEALLERCDHRADD